MPMCVYVSVCLSVCLSVSVCTYTTCRRANEIQKHVLDPLALEIKAPD